MFEESLVVSQIEHTSATKCWTMMGSLSLQAAIATVLIVLPLLHPEHLSFHATTPLVFTPLPAKPLFPQAQTEQSSTPTTQVLALPNAPTIKREILLHDPAPATDEPSVIGSRHATIHKTLTYFGRRLSWNAAVADTTDLSNNRPGRSYRWISCDRSTDIEGRDNREPSRRQWSGDAARCGSRRDSCCALPALSAKWRAYRDPDDDNGEFSLRNVALSE